MNLQELEQTLTQFKIVSSVMSTCFFIITSLICYIWKTDSKRNEKMYERHGQTLKEVWKTLDKLTTMTAVHDAKIQNLEK